MIPSLGEYSTNWVNVTQKTTQVKLFRLSFSVISYFTVNKLLLNLHVTVSY